MLQKLVLAFVHTCVRKCSLIFWFSKVTVLIAFLAAHANSLYSSNRHTSGGVFGEDDNDNDHIHTRKKKTELARHNKGAYQHQSRAITLPLQIFGWFRMGAAILDSSYLKSRKS